MAKQIMQFRYYGKDNSNKNYPENFYRETENKSQKPLLNGKLFDNYKNISALGIQAKPGAKFYLNETGYPITIGDTGIFEIDLQDLGMITKIRFAESLIDYYDNQGQSEDADRLLIDIIYEGGNSN